MTDPKDLRRAYRERKVAETAEANQAAWAAAGLPEWIGKDNVTAFDWRAAGERRWQATLPRGGFLDPADLLIVVNIAGTRFVRYASTFDDYPDRAEILEATFRHMEDSLAYEDLPTCEAPGCDKKAPQTFTAAAFGPLAGVQRAPGDQIHFCEPHGHDVYCAAAGAVVAEWLRPDAVYLTPEDQLAAAIENAYDGRTIGEANDAIRAALARLVPLTRSETT